MKARIAEMLLQRQSTWAIAEELGLAHSSVVYYSQQVRAEWRWRAQEAVEDKLAEDLALLERIEAKAWEEFIRSCEDFYRKEDYTRTVENDFDRERARNPILAKTVRASHDVKLDHKVLVESRVGSHQHLALILACCKLRGEWLGYAKAPTVPTDVRESARRVAEATGQPFDKVLAVAEKVAKDEWARLVAERK